jgi:hypothetical protein
MPKRFLIAVLMILLTSLVCTVAMPVGKAQTAIAKLYVDPPDIQNVTLVPNTTFNISVKVDNIPAQPGVLGIQFVLTWNSSLLNGVSMEEVIFHELTPASETDNIWKLNHKVYPSNVSYAYTYQDTDRAISGGYAPFNGSHTVAKITLKVVGIGKCPIHFDSFILGDPTGAPIQIQVADGFFSNLPPPPAPKAALLYIDPAKIVNPNLILGQNFTININIINASDLAGLEFKLGFNASALHANSVASGGFIPSSVTPLTQIDNTTGFISFNVSLSTPLNGDGNLTIVQFQVEADKVRNSTLHLYEVKLVNSTGQALPFSTADGSFTNARAILGDLNGDGIVNIKDAIVAANAFGSSPGSPNWNPDADLNGDGKINIIDFILLAANFGHSA